MAALEQLVRELGLPFGTFVVCLVSGFVPIVNAELFLIGARLLAPGAAIVPLVLLATAGQMTAKLIMYYGARGAMRLPRKAPPAALERLRVRLTEHPRRAWWLVFVSGSVGLPPLYLLSVAAGMLKFPLTPFLLLATAGRLLRFTAVLLFPDLLPRW